MSSQSRAKSVQNYNAKAIPQTCANCANYKSEFIVSTWNPEYKQEKNLRCGIGGFAIKKMGTCDIFVGKE